ncbi:hypothetical protein LTR86_010945 [Recurvomyces mirabilis]|nr:hypothetical protein LTR86_010945 [Recurvomyces mirabilis]
MSTKNVILVGAGGNLGSIILCSLLASSDKFNVSALSRETSSYVPPAGIQLYRTDYSHGTLVSAFKGKDAVVSAIDMTATVDQTKLIDAAIEAGVRRFIPAQFGSMQPFYTRLGTPDELATLSICDYAAGHFLGRAEGSAADGYRLSLPRDFPQTILFILTATGDSKNEAALSRLPLLGAKKAIITYLEEREDQISWTGIENGPFFDWGLERNAFGFDIPSSTATLYTPGHHKVKFSATTIATVGLAVARSLESRYAVQTHNKDLYIRSFTVSQDEVLASIERATGKQWTRKEFDLDSAVKKANNQMSRGDFSGITTAIVGMMLDPNTGCNFDARGEVHNDLLELPKELLDDVVQKVVNCFKNLGDSQGNQVR